MKSLFSSSTVAAHRKLLKSCTLDKKCFLLSMILSLTAPSALGQSLDRPLYMGVASTGENVWFLGGRAQCGDLPKSNRCWRNPFISYRLGAEEFETILDCDKGTFKWAHSLTTGKVYKDIKPSSAATKQMVRMACANELKRFKRMNSEASGK